MAEHRVEIREFKTKRFIETVNGQTAAFDRCIALYLRSGKRISFYFITPVPA